MVNAYIYCRVSSEEQGKMETGHISLNMQEFNCREYVNKQNWQIKKIIHEIGSARTMLKLSKLMSMIKEMKDSGLPSIIVVHDVSRFLRNTTDALNLLQELRKYNISIFSVREQIDTKTNAGQHAFRTMMSNAEYESDMISERVTRALEMKRKMGNQLGQAPYGYEVVLDNNIRKFVKNPYEQNVITFIVEAYKCQKTDMELTILMSVIRQSDTMVPIEFLDADGSKIRKLKPYALRYGEIAQLLNDYEVTKRGKEWSRSMIANIIRKHLCKSDRQMPPQIKHTMSYTVTKLNDTNPRTSKRRKTMVSVLDDFDSFTM